MKTPHASIPAGHAHAAMENFKHTGHHGAVMAEHAAKEHAGLHTSLGHEASRATPGVEQPAGMSGSFGGAPGGAVAGD